MARDFNKAISYKGNFDISGILTNLRRLRSELQTPSNQSSFFDIDREIRNIESFSTKIQAAIQKGFTNPQDLKEFEKLNKSLETSYNRISVGLKNISVKNLKTEAEDLEKVYKKQQQTLNNIVREEKERISTQLEGLKSTKLQKEYAKQLTDAAKNGEDLSNVQKTINEELSKRIQLQKQLKTEAEGSVRKQESSLFDAKSSATSLSTMGTRSFTTKGTTENVNKGQLNQIQNAYRGVLQDANTKTPEQAFKKITKALDDLGFSVKNNDTLMKNINTSFSEVNNSVKPLEKSLQAARKEVEGYDKEISNLEKNQDVLNTAFSDSSSSGLVESYRNTQVAARDTEKAQIALNKAQQESSPNITLLQQLDATMEKHAKATREATNETKQLSQSQIELEETFARIGQSAKYFFSLYNGLSLVKQTVVKTFNDVQDLDKAFAGIAMVSDYELGDLWKKYDSYAEMAKELGQETKDVIAASSLFIQQGLEMEEALSLTESTMTLATLAGSNFESATQQMTSALRGFNMEMTEGARVTDVYSELAAKAAADVDGIANAMSRTASIAASSGMSFENTSAFLTQMIEVTQESPENLGTALKSIIARFQELKTNVAGTAESAFDDLDYNKVDTALKSVGISIKDSTGQFRDLDEVFLELSGKFQSLDRNTQRYISTIAAGSRLSANRLPLVA